MFAQIAAIYVICGLVFIALCIERSFGQNFLLPILCQLQVRRYYLISINKLNIHPQALAPLFVIMRVAQSRIWPKSDHTLTTNGELITKTRFRPSLRLNLDFEVPKHDDSDDEDDMLISPPPSSSVRFSLPSPLPSAKVKKEVVPASDMLTPENARSWTNPPRYTMSQDDTLIISASDMLGALLEAGSSESSE